MTECASERIGWLHWKKALSHLILIALVIRTRLNPNQITCSFQWTSLHQTLLQASTAKVLLNICESTMWLNYNVLAFTGTTALTQTRNISFTCSISSQFIYNSYITKVKKRVFVELLYKTMSIWTKCTENKYIALKTQKLLEIFNKLMFSHQSRYYNL